MLGTSSVKMFRSVDEKLGGMTWSGYKFPLLSTSFLSAPVGTRQSSSKLIISMHASLKKGFLSIKKLQMLYDEVF